MSVSAVRSIRVAVWLLIPSSFALRMCLLMLDDWESFIRDDCCWDGIGELVLERSCVVRHIKQRAPQRA